MEYCFIIQFIYDFDCSYFCKKNLQVEVKEQTGQIILSGMGKLHLEIIHSRLLKEYRIEADLGPLQIAYRETICRVANDTKVHMSDV